MSDTVRRGVIAKRVAEEIKVVLVRRGSSATELAKQMGVTQSYLARRMRGAQAFDLDDIETIAFALELDPFDLLRAAQSVATLRYPDEADAPVIGRTFDRPVRGRPPNRPAGRASAPGRTYRTHASVA
jgi:transcriptional regulator with XRE-family HTH domain